MFWGKGVKEPLWMTAESYSETGIGFLKELDGSMAGKIVSILPEIFRSTLSDG